MIRFDRQTKFDKAGVWYDPDKGVTAVWYDPDKGVTVVIDKPSWVVRSS